MGDDIDWNSDKSWWIVCKDCKEVIHQQQMVDIGMCIGDEKVISNANDKLDEIAKRTGIPSMNAMISKEKDGKIKTSSIEFTGEKMKQYLKNNWLSLITLLVIAGFVAYLEFVPRYMPEVVAREDQCYWWVNDVNGFGMYTITDYCVQLKTICTASWHSIPCIWREKTSFLNESGEEIARQPRGCECNMIW